VIELLFGEDGVARVCRFDLILKDDVEAQAFNGGSMSGHAAVAAN